MKYITKFYNVNKPFNAYGHPFNYEMQCDINNMDREGYEIFKLSTSATPTNAANFHEVTTVAIFKKKTDIEPINEQPKLLEDKL